MTKMLASSFQYFHPCIHVLKEGSANKQQFLDWTDNHEEQVQELLAEKK